MKKRILAAFILFTRTDPRAAGDQVPNHFVNKYADDVTLAMQQTQSRLQPTVTEMCGIIGASAAVDFTGTTEANQVTTRFQDLQSVSTPHTRRWVDLSDFDWFDYIDSFDKLKVLVDPTNKYVMGAVAAHNRQKDRLIIAALQGNAREQTGQGNGGTSQYVALPAGQKVAVGGTNISLAKIRTAIELMNKNEAASPEEGGERFFVYTANQLTKLMADSNVTSSDWNTLRALQNYQVDTFMGMKWLRSELLPKSGNNRYCYIYGKNYLTLGCGQDVINDVSVNKTKRGFPIQVYSMQSLGAVRNQDTGVVEIACDETA
jgi:hypothetical protein